MLLSIICFRNNNNTIKYLVHDTILNPKIAQDVQYIVISLYYTVLYKILIFVNIYHIKYILIN